MLTAYADDSQKNLPGLIDATAAFIVAERQEKGQAVGFSGGNPV